MSVRRALSTLVILSIFLMLFCNKLDESSLRYFHLTLKSYSCATFIHCGKLSSSKDLVNRDRQNGSFKMAKLLKLINVALAAQLIVLAGDVSLNPGPVNLTSCSSKGLSICQWNIQRLTDEKFDEIFQSLTSKSNYENKLDILILTESFCSDTIPSSYYQIPGYNLHRKDREGRIGGGILVYTNECLSVKRCTDLETVDIEILWLKVCPHRSNRSLLVSGVYRPPAACKEHSMRIGQNIENAYLKNLEMIIMGDFNIDVLNEPCFSKHRLTKTLKSLGLTQGVDFITRPVSKTGLDHVWLSHPDRIQNNIFSRDIGLSDHLPVFVIRRLKN